MTACLSAGRCTMYDVLTGVFEELIWFFVFVQVFSMVREAKGERWAQRLIFRRWEDNSNSRPARSPYKIAFYTNRGDQSIAVGKCKTCKHRLAY